MFQIGIKESPQLIDEDPNSGPGSEQVVTRNETTLEIDFDSRPQQEDGIERNLSPCENASVRSLEANK